MHTLQRVPEAPLLVGREGELAELRSCAETARDGAGSLILLAGEAGVGKTRLAAEAAQASGLLSVVGVAPQDACPPYGPIVAALRSYTRARPDGLADCGPLTPFLALLLPELGPAPADADAPTLCEALCSAFRTIGRRDAAFVLLDDLHWADHSTLEALALLAPALESERCLVLGAYRNDEIARGHPLRRLRRELRRGGRLRELVLEPLEESGTGALAAQVLGARPAPGLRATLYARTQEMPFFVEELAAALRATGAIRRGSRGALLAPDADVPVPDTVREAVAVRIARGSHAARAALEVAAVAGASVDVDILIDLVGEAAAGEAIQSGLLDESQSGLAAFRHTLMRAAVYADVPWTRRRKLHRLVAERLELRRAPEFAVAEHWLAAREFQRAAPLLARAARAFAAVHAYRDALGAGRRAAEVWPDGADEDGRLALIADVGRYAQLAGELAEGAAAWRELADRRRLAGDDGGVAEAERELATTHELRGASELAVAARRAAAAAFARAGRAAEAAAELLAAAAHLDSARSVDAALQIVEHALAEAHQAGRRDLEARALGIRGTSQAKLGQVEEGLATARAALDLALADDLTEAAAESYQRLANVLENAGDYRRAWDAYQAGYDFCEARGADGAAQVCLVCLGAILLFTGEWDPALELDRRILASPVAPVGVRMGAKQHMGLIGAARGEARKARALLLESGAYAQRFARQRMWVWDALGQGGLDELGGATEAALDRARFIVTSWGESESVHYPVPALRWATTFCATHGAEYEARACAAALARLAARTVNPESLAALAHALGETALLDDDPAQAVGRFTQALETLTTLGLPYETAQTGLRAGAALVAADERERAIDTLTDAYHTRASCGRRRSPTARRASWPRSASASSAGSAVVQPSVSTARASPGASSRSCGWSPPVVPTARSHVDCS